MKLEGENFERINEYYHLKDEDLRNSLTPYLKMATTLAETTIAYVSIFDNERQYFISATGFQSEPVMRKTSICNLALMSKEIVVIEDLHSDKRTPPVGYEKYGFYAGVPILDSHGNILGTYCVMDFEPKAFGKKEQQLFTQFGLQVGKFLELRKDLRYLFKMWENSSVSLQDELKRIDEVKHKLAHDFRGPIGNLRNITETALSEQEYEVEEYINLFEIMDGTTGHILNLLKHLTDELLNENSKEKKIRKLDLEDTINSILEYNNLQGKYGQFEVTIGDLPIIYAIPEDIFLIFQNLIENGLKYNKSDSKKLSIFHEEQADQLVFHVKDNGLGINEEDLDSIFEEGKRVYKEDDIEGTGFGLWNVKGILEKQDERIWVKSTPGEGSDFQFTWQKGKYAQ